MTKEIRLNAFDMNCVGHIQHGMWTHPRDRSTEYNTIGYWQDLARQAGVSPQVSIRAPVQGAMPCFGDNLLRRSGLYLGEVCWLRGWDFVSRERKCGPGTNHSHGGPPLSGEWVKWELRWVLRRAHRQNTEVCIASGRRLFQLGAMFGVGRCGGIEKTSLISPSSDERRRRPHMGQAQRGRSAGAKGWRARDASASNWAARSNPRGGLYSMTSSARARIDGAISTPISRATLRLRTSSNLVGC
jgi:hypothetical protein